MEEFDNFIIVNELFEIGMRNGCFTWHNRRDGFLQIAEKFDRFIVSQAWKVSSILFLAKILSFSSFDHFPILLSLDKKVD